MRDILRDIVETALMTVKLPGKLVENEDYYFNEAGLMVFTREYHLKRGKCCGSACLHCPYDYVNVPEWKKPKHNRKSPEGK